MTTKRSLIPCHFQTRRGEQKLLGAAPGTDGGGISAPLRGCFATWPASMRVLGLSEQVAAEFWQVPLHHSRAVQLYFQTCWI